ncbi:MAG: hypothetical protein COZ18_12755 [Flexibacter sp. CG_4_10_14_3_um_filter_32_15]|nr:MAG: hypothetical protein COZ18_12755 [Flexibacter sp. CG_4_10_14_3_um_filter_32_15]
MVVAYKFTDKSYNNSKILSRITLGGINPEVDQAYEIYKNEIGWHRDYVYYGITPSSPNGRFSLNYKEHITTFQINASSSGSAMSGYRIISDQTGVQRQMRLS